METSVKWEARQFVESEEGLEERLVDGLSRSEKCFSVLQKPYVLGSLDKIWIPNSQTTPREKEYRGKIQGTKFLSKQASQVSQKAYEAREPLDSEVLQVDSRLLGEKKTEQEASALNATKK